MLPKKYLPLKYRCSSNEKLSVTFNIVSKVSLNISSSYSRFIAYISISEVLILED